MRKLDEIGRKVRDGARLDAADAKALDGSGPSRTAKVKT